MYLLKVRNSAFLLSDFFSETDGKSSSLSNTSFPKTGFKDKRNLLSSLNSSYLAPALVWL